MGARAARRRARPPEHQGRLARVRENAAQPGLPLLRQRRGRHGRRRTTSSRALYDAVVYSVGAQTDRQLGIPGEDLPGSWPATAFVAWYNGHPDFQDLSFDLSGERAVVIGNGNVALDVARMLALTPEELAPTDTTDAAIEAIARLRDPRDPRRRPARAGAGGLDAGRGGGAGRARGRRRGRRPGRPRARPGERGGAGGGGADRPPQHRAPARLRGRASPPASRARSALRFFSSPVAIHGDEQVEAIELVRNELGGRARAVATEERETIACGIVFRSVGYQGVALPGVPFDERSRDDPERRAAASSPPASTAAGWIKRGPSGVIGTNKKDATETVELLLEDARGRPAARPGAKADARDVARERGVEAVLTRAGRRSTARSAPRASRTGARGSSSSRWDALLAAARNTRYSESLVSGTASRRSRATTSAWIRS